jgi:hypothetical protein
MTRSATAFARDRLHQRLHAHGQGHTHGPGH